MNVNVLIADDDPVYVELVATRLRSKGFRVTRVVDAMQAFMTAVREPPDAILLDVKMPGGTGVDALRKLKALAKTSLIPVIVISGVHTPELRTSVLELGASAFLPKPVRFGQIYAALCKALGLEAPSESGPVVSANTAPDATAAPAPASKPAAKRRRSAE
jgi:DNA-binding response OmpR family regulator